MRHGILVGETPELLALRTYTFGGKSISPAGMNKISRADKLVWGVYEVEEPTNNTAVAEDRVTTVGPLTLNGDHFLRVTTVRDMTAQEISDRDDAIAAGEAAQTLGKAMYLAFNALLYLAKNPHNGTLTLQQFRTAIEDPANQAIDETAFRAWLKDLL